MPYVIDTITAQTINVNSSLMVDGNPVNVSSYHYIGDSSTNTNVDWVNGSLQEINLDNSPTLTFSSAIIGQELSLLLKQQTVGLSTITWPNNVIWNSGVTPTLQTVSAPSNIDNTFNTGNGFDSTVYSLAIQSDGKILVGGDFSDFNGNSVNYICRLNSDGSIDNTFNIGTGFDDEIFSLAIQSDGKIICGGSFSSYNGNNVNRIIRLNSNGSIDNTFNIGTGFNGSVLTLVIQSDGKIICGGSFSSYNGNSINAVIRLNSNGSIDNTFNIGTGFSGMFGGNVFSIDIQSDGKIICGGFFDSYDGNSVNYICRLNSDGSIDNTFNIGTGFDGSVQTLVIQSDGKIICGGSFSSYNGNSVSRICRLNSDGSIDNTFNIGTGFNDFVRTVTIQSDGKILVGGDFISYDGNSVNGIIRLLSSLTIIPVYNQVDFEYNGTYYIGSF